MIENILQIVYIITVCLCCRACKLYAAAKELVDGVALTAHNPEDQRRLQIYSSTLADKYSGCMHNATELHMFNNDDDDDGVRLQQQHRHHPGGISSQSAASPISMSPPSQQQQPVTAIAATSR